MEQITSKQHIWNEAGKAGFVLGLVSSAYMFIIQFLGVSSLGAGLQLVLNGVLWLAKFTGCIYLMRFFMLKLVAADKTADHSSTFRFGMITAGLSALVFAAMSFLNTAYLSADLMNSQYEQVIQQLAPMMDSNSLAAARSMMGNLPQMTFFSNLIYCFIYGTVLSAILSRMIPSDDPFADNTTDGQ